jgi:hypothetical protein
VRSAHQLRALTRSSRVLAQPPASRASSPQPMFSSCQPSHFSSTPIARSQHEQHYYQHALTLIRISSASNYHSLVIIPGPKVPLVFAAPLTPSLTEVTTINHHGGWEIQVARTNLHTFFKEFLAPSSLSHIHTHIPNSVKQVPVIVSLGTRDSAHYCHQDLNLPGPACLSFG